MDTLDVAEKENDESDWEYETHPTETETLYVTIDLAHNPNNIFRDRGPSALDGVSLKGRPVLQSVKVPDGPPVRNIEGQEFSQSRDTVQILDLHTRNPLISYHSKIYSCNWMSTLGTDLHFVQAPSSSISEGETGTNADEIKHPPIEPLLQNDGWALLGTASTKLVGHPVRPVPKDTTADSNGSQRTMTPSSAKGSHYNNSEADVSMRPVKISLGATATHSRQSSARFLEQLISIKQARGESDRVPLGSRTYEHIWRSEDKERQRNFVEAKAEGFHTDLIEGQLRHNPLSSTETEHRLPNTTDYGKLPIGPERAFPENMSAPRSEALTTQGSKYGHPYARNLTAGRGYGRPRGRRPRPFAWQLSGATGIDPNALDSPSSYSNEITRAPLSRNDSSFDRSRTGLGEGEGKDTSTEIAQSMLVNQDPKGVNIENPPGTRVATEKK